MGARPPRPCPRRPMAIPRRLRPTSFIPDNDCEEVQESGMHIVLGDGDQGEGNRGGGVGSSKGGGVHFEQAGRMLLLPVPRDECEAQELMQSIQNQKVAYLKAAIFELQKDNTFLLEKVQQQHKIAQSQSQDIVTRAANEDFDGKGFMVHKPRERLMANECKTTTPISSSELSMTEEGLQRLGAKPIKKNEISTTEVVVSTTCCLKLAEKVKELETRISNIQKQLEAQALLLEKREQQVCDVERSQGHMLRKFQRKLQLYKHEQFSWLQAYVLATRTERLQETVNQNSERDGQVQKLVSALEEHYRALFLKALKNGRKNIPREQQSRSNGENSA